MLRSRTVLLQQLRNTRRQLRGREGLTKIIVTITFKTLFLVLTTTQCSYRYDWNGTSMWVLTDPNQRARPAIMRSTDLLLQFPPVRRLDFSFAKVGSIRAFDIGTMENERDAIHCSTFLDRDQRARGGRSPPYLILHNCFLLQTCSAPLKANWSVLKPALALVNHGERL